MDRDEVLKMTAARVRELIVFMAEDGEMEEPEELFGPVLFCLVREMRGEMKTVKVAYGITRVLGQFLEHFVQEENIEKKMFPRGQNDLCPENK